MKTTNIGKPVANHFAVSDGPVPSDVLMSWDEVEDFGLDEVPSDFGPSDYQIERMNLGAGQ
jgi:hypothetical protein